MRTCNRKLLTLVCAGCDLHCCLQRTDGLGIGMEAMEKYSIEKVRVLQHLHFQANIDQRLQDIAQYIKKEVSAPLLIDSSSIPHRSFLSSLMHAKAQHGIASSEGISEASSHTRRGISSTSTSDTAPYCYSRLSEEHERLRKKEPGPVLVPSRRLVGDSDGAIHFDCLRSKTGAVGMP